MKIVDGGTYLTRGYENGTGKKKVTVRANTDKYLDGLPFRGSHGCTYNEEGLVFPGYYLNKTTGFPVPAQRSENCCEDLVERLDFPYFWLGDQAEFHQNVADSGWIR